MSRTWIYRIGVVVLALAWYGITAIESYTMGMLPLTRHGHRVVRGRDRRGLRVEVLVSEVRAEPVEDAIRRRARPSPKFCGGWSTTTTSPHPPSNMTLLLNGVARPLVSPSDGGGHARQRDPGFGPQAGERDGFPRRPLPEADTFTLRGGCGRQRRCGPAAIPPCPMPCLVVSLTTTRGFAMQKTLFAVLFAIPLFLFGCPADDDDDTSSTVCDSGATQLCNCVGGTEGVQVCEEDGSGWGECDCSSGDDDDIQGDDDDATPGDDDDASPGDDDDAGECCSPAVGYRNNDTSVELVATSFDGMPNNNVYLVVPDDANAVILTGVMSVENPGGTPVDFLFKILLDPALDDLSPVFTATVPANSVVQIPYQWVHDSPIPGGHTYYLHGMVTGSGLIKHSHSISGIAASWTGNP